MTFLVSLFLATSALAQNTVSALGTAELKVEPNVAYYNVSVTSKGESVKLAQTKNANESKEVIDVLTSQFGLKKEDWRNSISTQKDVEYENNKPVIKGQIVRNQITVRVRQLDQLGAMMDAMANLGAESGYVNYALENGNEAKALVLQMAAENAKLNANALLKPYGKEVGTVIAIVQSGTSAPPVPKAAYAARAESASLSGGASTEVSAGQIVLSAYVTVIFEIK